MPGRTPRTFSCRQTLHTPTSPQPLLEIGCPVLIEKPMATTQRGLRRPAGVGCVDRAAATLGVNQNFVFHPAFARLRRAIAAGTYGRARFVDCIYTMPLAPASGATVRPLDVPCAGQRPARTGRASPVADRQLGRAIVQRVSAIAGPPTQIAPGARLFPTTTASLTCAALPAQLRFAVGEGFPVWQVSVVCDDGLLVADMLANQLLRSGADSLAGRRSTRSSPAARTAGAILRGATGNASDYAISTLAPAPAQRRLLS
jgi:hypothetical protein